MHIHTYSHAYIHTYMHAYIYRYMQGFKHACIHMYMQTYIYAYIYASKLTVENCAAEKCRMRNHEYELFTQQFTLIERS